MIIKPAGWSRRGFLQSIVGITATIIFPGRRIPVGIDISKMMDDMTLERVAIEAMNEFTRVKLREDGFYRRILPPLPIANDMLDRSVPTTALPKGRYVNGVWRIDPRAIKWPAIKLEDVRI